MSFFWCNFLSLFLTHSLTVTFSRTHTQVIVNYENADLSPRDRAMLDFAMAVCRSDTITDQHFLSLEEVGFDREDAWDIAAIAAFFAMSNRLAHLTDMRPNSEFYNMGRVPREQSRDKSKPEGSGETGQ